MQYNRLKDIADATGVSVKALKNWKNRGIIQYGKTSKYSPVIVDDGFAERLRLMKVMFDNGVRLHYAAVCSGFSPLSSPGKTGRRKGQLSKPKIDVGQSGVLSFGT